MSVVKEEEVVSLINLHKDMNLPSLHSVATIHAAQ